MKFRCDIPSGTLVLVTGASGFTGSVLVRTLCEAGLKVRAVRRQSSKIEHLKDLPIEWILGNVYEESTIRKACQNVEYVFHVAAAYREAKIQDEIYSLVHVKSTQLIAQEVLKNPSFKRLVHVSTVGVHGHIDEPPANEEYRFRPGDLYQNTKAEAELWLHDFAKMNQLPYTVIRPAAIYGPGDRRLLKIFRMASKNYFPVLGSGKCFYHLIHVEDLAQGMILAATHPAALSEVFICGNDKHTSLLEMEAVIATAIGKKPKIIRLPVWPFFLVGAICEVICKPLGIEPPIYRRRVAFYTKDRAFDTRKIRERLGFQTRYSNEEGLRQTAKWYQQHGWLDLGSSM